MRLGASAMPRYARVWALRAMPEPPGVKGVLLISAGAVLSQSQISDSRPPNGTYVRTPGPIFSTPGIIAGIVMAIMTLGPLCGAAFVVGR